MRTTQSEVFEERFLQFGVQVIKFTNESLLPRSVTDQLIRAATSIGANYSEAQNASSRADFRNKIFIAKKEAAETRYWLRLAGELTEKENVSSLVREVHEIIMILQKIVTSLQKRNDT